MVSGITTDGLIENLDCWNSKYPKTLKGTGNKLNMDSFIY